MATQVRAERTALLLAAVLVMLLSPARAMAAVEEIATRLDAPVHRLDQGEPPALQLAWWGGARRFGGGWGGGYGGGYGGRMPYGYGYQAAPPSYPPPQQYGGYPPPAYGAPPQEMYRQYEQSYAYPQQGQNPQQAAGAMNECQTWASEQTGYHPMAPGAPQGGPQGGMGRAALQGGGEGAALGAIGGSFGGHAGRGAEMGAAMGGVFSLLRRREQMQAEQQQQQQEQQAHAMASATYSRALESCLTARGYNVR